MALTGLLKLPVAVSSYLHLLSFNFVVTVLYISLPSFQLQLPSVTVLTSASQFLLASFSFLFSICQIRMPRFNFYLQLPASASWAVSRIYSSFLDLDLASASSLPSFSFSFQDPASAMTASFLGPSLPRTKLQVQLPRAARVRAGAQPRPFIKIRLTKPKARGYYY